MYYRSLHQHDYEHDYHSATEAVSLAESPFDLLIRLPSDSTNNNGVNPSALEGNWKRACYERTRRPAVDGGQTPYSSYEAVATLNICGMLKNR